MSQRPYDIYVVFLMTIRSWLIIKPQWNYFVVWDEFILRSQKSAQPKGPKPGVVLSENDGQNAGN